MLPFGYIFHKTIYHIISMLMTLSFIFLLKTITVLCLICLHDIKYLMSLNFLQFNNDKTEIMVFGPTVASSGIVKHLGPLSSNLCNCVGKLGVAFDPVLSFDKQISAFVESSFFQLRSIARIKKMLSLKILQTVIHAFITSRLDYCNSLYLGLPKSSVYRLQLVQNTAAKL